MNEIIIRPKKIWSLIDISEIWQYRELFYVFVWRDIKVRYKQTLLGVMWVIFQPLLTMFIFTFFFGKLAKIQSGDLPYSLFVLCGLVFWSFFSGALSHASDSMLTNENIIKKVYFPKIILPLSSIITYLIDFIINLVLLLVFAAFLGYFPNILILIIIPFGILLTAVTVAGLGLFLSSFNVKYRDVRYILPFFIQLLLFITPVIYPMAIVSDKNKIFMSLNPMSAVIEVTRFIFSQNYAFQPHLIIISIISSILMLILGWIYFRKTEQFFADIV